MNGFLKAIAIIAPIVLAGGIEVYGETSNVKQSETTQQQETNVKRAVLPVALPDLATVWSKDNSVTGQITQFDREGLFVDDVEFFPIDRIKRVVFNGSVWDENSGGKFDISRIARCLDCRNTLQGVPITALSWQSPTETAELEVSTVVTEEEYQKLLDKTDRNIYVIDEIFVNSSETLTIKVITVARQQ